MNKQVKGSLKLALLAAFLLSAAPAARAGVFIRIAPPDVRVETHEERRGYIWQSGYWRWRGQRHEWTNGRYLRERQGRHWTDGRWDHNDRGYFWVGGRWER